MLIKAEDAKVRSFADVIVRNYITKEHCNELSVAVATLSGTHPESRSNRSTRAYYIIAGSGTISVSGVEYEVEKGDAILVPRGELHSLQGTLTYALINTPAFDPSQEQSS